MPELLTDGLPARTSRSKFDFSQWADGQAWKFVKGTDYDSSTETFRINVRKWAKANGLDVELRPYPAVDGKGQEIPLTSAIPRPPRPSPGRPRRGPAPPRTYPPTAREGVNFRAAERGRFHPAPTDRHDPRNAQGNSSPAT
jgi:hypothetical protein